MWICQLTMTEFCLFLAHTLKISACRVCFIRVLFLMNVWDLILFVMYEQGRLISSLLYSTFPLWPGEVLGSGWWPYWWEIIIRMTQLITMEEQVGERVKELVANLSAAGGGRYKTDWGPDWMKSVSVRDKRAAQRSLTSLTPSLG